MQLTQDQIDFFHREGYLSLPALASPDEVARLRTHYDRIFAERAGRDSGDQFDLAGTDEEGKEAALPQILNPAKYAPELGEGEYIQNARAIVKQLWGPEADCGLAHAILKPPGNAAPTPWHQDEAYWDPMLDYRSLSIWVPLQDTNIAMGCMQFIPGSHKGEVQPHQSIGGDPRVHGLECLGVDESEAVACELPAGGCTIHDGRTLHYTGANQGTEPRRALILMGGLPATPRATERRFPWNEIKQTARAERERSQA